MPRFSVQIVLEATVVAEDEDDAREVGREAALDATYALGGFPAVDITVTRIQ